PNGGINEPLVGCPAHVDLDDSRPRNLSNADIILGYERDGLVRYRIQRERFLTEYTPPIGVCGAPAQAIGLRHISMNSNMRLKFVVDDGGGDEIGRAHV